LRRRGRAASGGEVLKGEKVVAKGHRVTLSPGGSHLKIKKRETDPSTEASRGKREIRSSRFLGGFG